ncbi:MAG: hypothetical protein KDB65_06035 [Calditrichaeota bacterium]|nr:hypothetical protein [Calditrichota bacterium]MCB9367778.1 hypothetical protein [Calditrichota bacterium]
MTSTDKKPKKSKPADIEKIERLLRDADISPEEYQALKDELKRNRRRNEGAGDNPLDNLYEES